MTSAAAVSTSLNLVTGLSSLQQHQQFQQVNFNSNLFNNSSQCKINNLMPVIDNNSATTSIIV